MEVIPSNLFLLRKHSNGCLHETNTLTTHCDIVITRRQNVTALYEPPPLSVAIPELAGKYSWPASHHGVH